MTGDTERLSVVLGRGIRAARDRHGVTADDFATAARKVGLSWGRSTLTAIETGRRGLTAEEFVLLPLVLSVAELGDVTLLDLIGEREWVALSATVTASRRGVAQALHGESLTFRGDERGAWRAEHPNEVVLRWADETRDLARLLPPDTPYFDEGTDALRDSRHEAVAKAARKLGRPAVQVAHAARRRWNRSFVEERDARLADRVPAGASPATLRATRGHVTRELLADLAEDLTSYPTPKEH